MVIYLWSKQNADYCFSTISKSEIVQMTRPRSELQIKCDELGMLVFTHGSVAGTDSIQSHLVKTFSKISGWIKWLFNDTVHCAKYFAAAAGLHFTVFDSVLMDLLIKLAAKGHMRSYRSSFSWFHEFFFHEFFFVCCCSSATVKQTSVRKYVRVIHKKLWSLGIKD